MENPRQLNQFNLTQFQYTNLIRVIQQVPPQGAVATDSQLCSQIGVDVLKKLGGNAVDAVVASTLCMCVVNPHIISLGG